MPRCNVCNDLVFEVLPAPQWPALNYPDKSFIISKKAEEFKKAAALGCVPCNVVLQAIAAYDIYLRPQLAPTGPMSEDQIQLSGNGNEPLGIDFWLPFTRVGGVRFELFEKWDHSFSHAPLFSAVGLGSNPPDVLDITYAGWRAKRWISRCDVEHECGRNHIPLLPTRVLAIKSDPIKLIAPPSGMTGRFAALSYCWGSTGNLTTTSNNIKEREAGIKWETLPNLFQDVVQITRQIGIHFLWIDALCIIQGDQADWQRESAKMGSIYAGAYVTIACESAADTSYRLTNSRNCTLKPVDSFSSTTRDQGLKALKPVVIDGHTHSFFVRETLDHVDILREPPLHELSFPLMLRGWAMQERLLSTRILHFTAHEMIWECQKTFYCECGGISQDTEWQGDTAKRSFEKGKAIFGLDRKTSLPNLTCPGDTARNPSFVLVWTKLMTAYSTRRLTFDSDRLPGISAIARNFGLAKTYMAGVWLEDLPWHLAWGVSPKPLYSKPLRPKPLRPSVYNGPTWSWASVSTDVRWPHALDAHYSRSQVRVIEASTAPMGLDEFGQVAWGRVRLRAPVAAAKAVKTDDSYPLVVYSNGENLYEPDAMFENISFEEDQGQITLGQRSASNVEDHKDIWCIPVLGVGEFGDEAFCPHWVMVVAKATAQSMQRALLDPTDQPEAMICERIGFMDLGPRFELGIDPSGIRKWLSSSEFKEKEIIII